jgi:hypothetical protein
MRPNKRLLILEDQIFTDQKYTEIVKLKRRTKLIFLVRNGIFFIISK